MDAWSFEPSLATQGPWLGAPSGSRREGEREGGFFCLSIFLVASAWSKHGRGTRNPRQPQGPIHVPGTSLRAGVGAKLALDQVLLSRVGQPQTGRNPRFLPGFHLHGFLGLFQCLQPVAESTGYLACWPSPRSRDQPCSELCQPASGCQGHKEHGRETSMVGPFKQGTRRGREERGWVALDARSPRRGPTVLGEVPSCTGSPAFIGTEPEPPPPHPIVLWEWTPMWPSCQCSSGANGF